MVKKNGIPWNKGKRCPQISESKKGQAPWNKGLIGYRAGIPRHSYNEEFRKKISESKRGIVPATAFKKGRISPMRGKNNVKLRGPNNPNWKGGISEPYRLIRASIEWNAWRTKVFEKDDYSCQCCGTNKNLHPHHLISSSKNPEFRFEDWNGQTLCSQCHLDLHRELGFR
jgi:5-methylcytosine-specific restriction endonuclease McrA